jgi:hypothetical protein
MTRGTLKLAAMVVFTLVFAGCGDDDDAQPSKDGGADSGPNSGGGKTGADGGLDTGSGGKKATGTGSGGSGGGSGGAPSSGGGGSSADVDGGTSDSGASMDASTPGDGGSDGMQTASGCPGLLECCAPLPMMDRMNCELVANNADDATCDQFKTIVCPAAAADGGVDPQACTTLNDCCESLPRGPARVACATTVSNAVALDCQQVTEAFCPTGGNPDACTSLTDCCAGLPRPQRKSCNMIVDQGLPAACETLEASLCP